MLVFQVFIVQISSFFLSEGKSVSLVYSCGFQLPSCSHYFVGQGGYYVSDARRSYATEGEPIWFDGWRVRLIHPGSPTALIKSLCWTKPSLLHHQLALPDLVHHEDFGYKVRQALIRKGMLHWTDPRILTEVGFLWMTLSSMVATCGYFSKLIEIK